MAGDADAPEPLDRPDLYVVARFLDRLWSPDQEYTKSKLQAATRLNWDLFKRYLAFLEAKGFVTVGPGKAGHDVVRITKAGVAAHRRIVEWIRDVIGEDHL